MLFKILEVFCVFSHFAAEIFYRVAELPELVLYWLDLSKIENQILHLVEIPAVKKKINNKFYGTRESSVQISFLLS